MREQGLLELAALEEQAGERVPTWYNVYFREEYFGHVPAELLPQVEQIMAEAGGLERTGLTLRSMHRPAAYPGMVRQIVGLLNEYVKTQSNL